jgi:TrmH family RNA methyltransferase
VSERITSTHNPVVRRARKLVRNRRYREAEGAFLIEGIAHVRRALEHRAPIDAVLLAPDLLTSSDARRAVEAAGVEVVELGREAFESIVDRDHPAGLAAIVRMTESRLTDLVAAPDSLFVALHDVGNPGNLGSIIRTVDAVRGGGVAIVGESTDQYHPAAVKASMGTIFSTPICRVESFDDLLAWALMEAVTVVTTSAQAETSLWDADIALPALLVFGSEAVGLPPEIHPRAAVSVRIPMEGSASSLNLAVAAGIVLYDLKRPRS